MKTQTQEAPHQGGMARRQFLRYAGTGAAMAAGVLTMSACHKDKMSDRVDIGSGDLGILNYAYALEQLEAAFYTQVVASPFSGITASETALLTDIRDHEVAHRELFKAALGGNGITGFQPNFGSINFASRNSVLGAAKAFEDLGVAAYNGAGALIQKADYLVLAGKIVSVEARHAALLRDLIQYNTFVDSSVVDISNTSMEKSKSIPEVLSVANQFLGTVKISAQAYGSF